MAKLESKLKRLESEVRWLQRAMQENGERNGHSVFGPCPNCESGVLASEADRLHCATCGYVRFL